MFLVLTVDMGDLLVELFLGILVEQFVGVELAADLLDVLVLHVGVLVLEVFLVLAHALQLGPEVLVLLVLGLLSIPFDLFVLLVLVVFQVLDLLQEDLDLHLVFFFLGLGLALLQDDVPGEFVYLGLGVVVELLDDVPVLLDVVPFALDVPVLLLQLF